jgi:hypothetical protein
MRELTFVRSCCLERREDAPTAYTARTTKLVLHRPPLAC